MKVKYKSTGIVYGYFWGGGEGGYAATKLEANKLSDLINEAKQKLDNGSLDAGMGYESLKGAILLINKITTIVAKGKEFCNTEYITRYIGNLTRKEKNFLLECAMNM